MSCVDVYKHNPLKHALAHFLTPSSISGQESFKIDNGQHEYPFWFSLPDSIPSSYESIEGNVRYTIGAILDRPWKTNTKYKTAFTVNTVVDLNLDPEAQVNIQCKTFNQ